MSATIPLLGVSLWLIVKIFVLFGLAIYLVFALVMVKQVKLMTGTLNLPLEKFVILLSYAHLVFAVLVFILALAIL